MNVLADEWDCLEMAVWKGEGMLQALMGTMWALGPHSNC
jgi:hypothetical protein